jgi:excisionase family DNA binding protein
MTQEVIAMADGAYRPPEGYLTMAQAQAALGISKPTLQRMVHAGALATFRDQRNRRVRLVKAEDVERLAQPLPAHETEQGKAAA